MRIQKRWIVDGLKEKWCTGTWNRCEESSQVNESCKDRVSTEKVKRGTTCLRRKDFAVQENRGFLVEQLHKPYARIKNMNERGKHILRRNCLGEE